MSEYSSPFRNSRGSDVSNNADDSGDYVSFVSTPSPGRNSTNNWSRSNQKRNHNFYTPNHNFRHSTPHNRGQNRMHNRPYTSSPFNRGQRNNYDRDNKSNTADYFHPSMLENPWAELEKKYEQSMAQAAKNTSQDKAYHSNSSSDSGSESDCG